MHAVVVVDGAAFDALPSGAELASIFSPQALLDTLGESVEEIVPGTRGITFNDTVRFAAKTYGAAG